MASIQNHLNQIKNAIFGKDVRQSIHDAIKQCYDDASVDHDNANMEVKLARGTHETLNDRITENEKNQEKKDKREWGVIKMFRSCYSSFPIGELSKSESPDFLLQNEGRLIGIELTELKYERADKEFNLRAHEDFLSSLMEEAQKIIAEQRAEIKGEPQNLEEQAISLVGREIYTKLIKGYTEKQWGRDCKDLPPFIIKRLPVRYTYDNNYFNDRYQGIPEGGYNVIIEKLFDGIEVRLNTDFFSDKEGFLSLADKCLYTGTVDAFFDYKLGHLGYRSLKFETETLDCENYQGVAVVNYNEREIPFTRIIEHKHFEFGKQEKTVITREYPADWHEGDEPYYPINDEQNNSLYEQYAQLAKEQDGILFGGRLGMYKYYDMDKCIEAALNLCDEEL